MNNAYKKIYKLIIILTVISMLIVTISTVSPNNTWMYKETGMILINFATSFIGTSILLSRNANVIANRKNILGNIGTIVLLFGVILSLIQMIFDFEPSTTFENIKLYTTVYITMLILIFEVPEANTAHEKFQRIVAAMTTITFIFAIFLALQAKTLTSSSALTSSAFMLYGFTGMSKIFIVLFLTTLTGFIINPMLRVYYIEEDYSTMNEIDKILYSSANANYTTAPNPNKMIDPRYLSSSQSQQIQTSQMQQQHTPQPTPQVAPPTPVVEPVEEIPREKVINPNFKPSELPQAVIPTITSEPIQSQTVETTPSEPIKVAIPTANETPTTTDVVPEVTTETTAKTTTENNTK